MPLQTKQTSFSTNIQKNLGPLNCAGRGSGLSWALTLLALALDGGVVLASAPQGLGHQVKLGDQVIQDNSGRYLSGTLAYGNQYWSYAKLAWMQALNHDASRPLYLSLDWMNHLSSSNHHSRELGAGLVYRIHQANDNHFGLGGFYRHYVSWNNLKFWTPRVAVEYGRQHWLFTSNYYFRGSGTQRPNDHAKANPIYSHYFVIDEKLSPGMDVILGYQWSALHGQGFAYRYRQEEGRENLLNKGLGVEMTYHQPLGLGRTAKPFVKFTHDSKRGSLWNIGLQLSMGHDKHKPMATSDPDQIPSAETDEVSVKNKAGEVSVAVARGWDAKINLSTVKQIKKRLELAGVNAREVDAFLEWGVVDLAEQYGISVSDPRTEILVSYEDLGEIFEVAGGAKRYADLSDDAKWLYSQAVVKGLISGVSFTNAIASISKLSNDGKVFVYRELMEDYKDYSGPDALKVQGLIESLRKATDALLLPEGRYVIRDEDVQILERVVGKPGFGDVVDATREVNIIPKESALGKLYTGDTMTNADWWVSGFEVKWALKRKLVDDVVSAPSDDALSDLFKEFEIRLKALNGVIVEKDEVHLHALVDDLGLQNRLFAASKPFAFREYSPAGYFVWSVRSTAGFAQG